MDGPTIELCLPTGLPELPKEDVGRSHSQDGGEQGARRPTLQTLHMKGEVKLSPAEKKVKNEEYLIERDVGLFLSVMLMELYDEMPDHPMQWCSQFFLRHDEMNEAQEKWQHKGVLTVTTEKRLWSASWRIPFVINELLAAILEEKPENPDAFAGSWFRWNSKSYHGQKHTLPDNWVPSKSFD